MQYSRFIIIALPFTLFSLPAAAQTRTLFSVDWNSPVVGAPDCTTGIAITEGDILMPCGGTPAFGPLPAPAVAITGGPGGLGLALHPGCVGHPGGTPCGVEVDAFSQGRDDYFMQNAEIRPGDIWFSVDEFASGFPGTTTPPNLLTEFPAADGSADAMINDRSMPPAPLPPAPGIGGHVGTLDGDGLVSASGYVYPGLGLREPNPPSGAAATVGDNLDALNIEPPTTSGPPYYFSLDAGTAFFDPCTGLPNSGSALAHGFSGGAVLTNPGVGPAVIYAPAPMLGLDLIGGFGSDDLDALILRENGDGNYIPSALPYDWTAGLTDMLMFSVRRGSAVIGAPDSAFGIPIEEGDILVPPIAGGVSPFPAIWVAAENLGLRTLRSGTPGLCNGDELDALDHLKQALRDCNANGTEDTIDIVLGTSTDVNLNGVPDECEPPILLATPYCFCAAGPCGNDYAAAGCRNSTGIGALLTASGSSWVVPDDLVLTVSDMPTFQFGIIFYGTLQVGPLPFGDGLRCAGGNVCRFSPQNSGALGQISRGPGLVAATAASSCPILAGSTWNFQGWFRDPVGPCLSGFNTSNAVKVVFY